MRAPVHPARRTVRCYIHMSSQDSPGKRDFFSLYSHGFARVAAAVPRVRIAEPEFNAERTIELARRASAEHAALVTFPELGLSGYSIEDLFHQQALLDGVLEGLAAVRAATAELESLVVVGAPLRADSGVFNTAVVLHRGHVLGVVPKSYLPEYHEFYEKRHFRAARDAVSDEIGVLGEQVPFGSRLLFACRDLPGLCVHVEICEDVWVPIPPSTYGAVAGATVLVNLSGSPVTVARASYRRLLCASQSGRTISGYVYTAAGLGEHDLGHQIASLSASSLSANLPTSNSARSAMSLPTAAAAAMLPP